MVFNLRTFSSSESDEDGPTPPKSFSLKELQVATQDFSHRNIVGEGDFGMVYQGCLADGSQVVVKRAICINQVTEQIFEREMQVASSVSTHPNVLSPRGFCRTERELLLVYPLMIHDSLASNLGERSERPTGRLDWTTRTRIALGAARGLAHLHDQGSVSIIHGHICSYSILLNAQFEAVIAGFCSFVIMNKRNVQQPPVTTVNLEVDLQCKICREKILKIAKKTKGVQSICLDTKENMVTVMAVVDRQALVESFMGKMKRPVKVEMCFKNILKIAKKTKGVRSTCFDANRNLVTAMALLVDRQAPVERFRKKINTRVDVIQLKEDKVAPGYDHVYVDNLMCGMAGFIAPEYKNTGKCTLKNDVFAYGRMLLELITGQTIPELNALAADQNLSLDEWIGNIMNENELGRVLDPNLQGNYMEEEAEELVRLALLCAHQDPSVRPEMSEVARMLESQFRQWDPSSRSSWSQSEFDSTPYYSFPPSPSPLGIAP